MINRKYSASNFNSLKDFSSIVQNTKEYYIEGNIQPEFPIRTEILQSWKRSKMFGVNPYQKRVEKSVKKSQLQDSRERNNKLLYFANKDIAHFMETLGDKETIITISDNNGLLIDAYGDTIIKKKAEEINFLPGALWSEEIAGTNAIGTVIKNKQPIQILFTEHFSAGWKDWFCAAAPIFHPITNELIGVLDLSGKWKNTNSHTLGLAISKANKLTRRIEELLYSDGIQMNPFIKTMVNSYEHGVMLLDESKQILKMNDKLAAMIKDINISKNLVDYPEIEKIVDYVLHNKHEIKVEEEVSIENKKYICTVQPVVLDEHMMIGIFVYLREIVFSTKHEQNAQSPKKSNTKPITKYTFDNMIGSSKEFNKTKQRAMKAANLNSTLLLHGETGTGKEMFAQAIHQYSARRDKPFIAINCGAIPNELIESELFGYESGAFTGANPKGKPGKFELANGGTLFLDEIGDMPLNVQVHLLRVLEDRVVTRVGGSKSIPIDVRIIAATHRDLKESVKKGDFREDLLFRLRVIQLNIPSLRDRAADIPDLARYYVHLLSKNFGTENIELLPKTIKHLQAYSWPGNIRELRNVIEQALFNMEGNIILPNDLPAEIVDVSKNENPEKEHLIQAIQLSGGNITEAAERLGISRATMYRRMKKYGIMTD